MISLPRVSSRILSQYPRVMVDYDVAVIGGGSGGLAFAKRAAGYGAKVVVIDRSGNLGGTCVNAGCVPKKITYSLANFRDFATNVAPGYGVFGDLTINYNTFATRRAAYIKRLNNIYSNGLKSRNIDFVVGTAELQSPNENIHTVKVIKGPDNEYFKDWISHSDNISVGESIQNITAHNVIVAVGTKPSVPHGFYGVEHCIDSNGFFELNEIPAKTAVIGAGYIAVELACMLQTLGSEVTLVVRGDKALRQFEPFLADHLDSEMKKHGMNIVTGFSPQGVTLEDGKKSIVSEDRIISGFDTVIVAIGREPHLAGLGIDTANVELTKAGYINTDEYQSTNIPGITALGDVTGRAALAPVAIAAGRRLADRLYGKMPKAKLDYDNIPTVVFSHPPLATCGLTEKQAREKYESNDNFLGKKMIVKTYISKFVKLSDSLMPVEPEEKPRSGIKLIVAGEEEVVVGIHMFGEPCDEIIQGFALAVKKGLTKGDLDDFSLRQWPDLCISPTLLWMSEIETPPYEDLRPITDSDAWTVLDTYLISKGLSRQQIDSFNNFVKYKIQWMVDETPPLVIRPSAPRIPGCDDFELYEHRFKFRNVRIGTPTYRNSDGVEAELRPNEARIRNLTYAAELYVDVWHAMYVIKKGTPTTEELASGDVLLDETGIPVGQVKREESAYHQRHAVIRNPEEASHEPEYLVVSKTNPLAALPLGKLPLMLRSVYCPLSKMNADQLKDAKECKYDFGGYFIVNGAEKVVVAMDRLSNNFIYVTKKKAPGKYSWVAEIRSQQDEYSTISVFSVKMIAAGRTNKPALVCSVPSLSGDVPLIVLLRALGAESDQEIVELISPPENEDHAMQEVLIPTLEASSERRREGALEILARKSIAGKTRTEERIAFADDVLKKELLHHLGIGNFKVKIAFIGYMVRKLLNTVLGRIPQDDCDHFARKRIDLSGVSMLSSFSQLFRQMTRDVRRLLQRTVENGKFPNIRSAVHEASQIEKGLVYQLATGNWGRDRTGKAVRFGVSQVLNRLTYMSSLSHVRRMNAPLDRSGKIARPRQLHSTHWCRVCPAETPEGEAVGLVKNLSLSAAVTIGESSDNVCKQLDRLGVEKLDSVPLRMIHEKCKVFVNGNWIGMHFSGKRLASAVAELRAREHISCEISVVYLSDSNEIIINTDAGRAMRPLFIVREDQELVCRKREIEKLKDLSADDGWAMLMRSGAVSFLDTQEEDAAMVAMFLKDLKGTSARVWREGYETRTYTHCELHPSVMLGVCATIIPFSHHNQSPRNCYQSAMGKQALGCYATNFMVRLDTLATVLCYPQKPLVCTRGMKYLRFRELPAGCNAIVYIMCHTGYNQEDSLILNKASLDRGFMRSMFLRSYYAEEKRQGGQNVEAFLVPSQENTHGMRRGDYSKLDTDAFVPPGTRVFGDDILIGKVAKVQAMKDDKETDIIWKDVSVGVRSAESGVVDTVMLSVNSKSLRCCKVRVRSYKIPTVGDKFASRHGQKGTGGLLSPEADLPFTSQGITPDIIMNPHAVPSRMTIGHLIECLCGKVASIRGCEGNATPFGGVTLETITMHLDRLGYQRYGNETVYSGTSGQRIEQRIFIGPTYYQRLKHLVEDKIHSRSRGPMQMLVRQPAEGRGKDGGLRFGEMERDCMVSHGASKFLKERLFDVSDPYRAHACPRCGLLAAANLNTNSYDCKRCLKMDKVHSYVVQVNLPYACKLLIQELASMCIATRMRVHMA